MFKNLNFQPLLFGFSLLLLITSCKKDETANLEELDLMSHGLPILIKAPAGSTIEKMDLTFQQDVTVKKGDEFYVQIFASDATTNDPKEVKEALLKEVKRHPYFSEVIEEEDVGFIYKTEVDSAHTNYGFRYVRIQADKEYTFQTGLIGTFDLDQVKRMYKAVK